MAHRKSSISGAVGRAMPQTDASTLKSSHPLFRFFPRTFIVFAVFFLGAALSLRLSSLQFEAERSRLRGDLELRIDVVRNNVIRELYAALSLTQGLVGVVRIQGGVSSAQFHALARELSRHSNLIRNIALAPDNIIRFVYPYEENKQALGLDYRKTPDQLGAVERAIAERRTVAAGPVRLVQGGVGFIGRTPIFITDPDGAHERYWGMASTVIDFDALLRTVGVDAFLDQYSLALRGKDGGGAAGDIFWGDEAVFASDPVALDITLPSGSWRLGAVPRGGGRFSSPSPPPGSRRAFSSRLHLPCFFSKSSPSVWAGRRKSGGGGRPKTHSRGPTAPCVFFPSAPAPSSPLPTSRRFFGKSAGLRLIPPGIGLPGSAPLTMTRRVPSVRSPTPVREKASSTESR